MDRKASLPLQLITTLTRYLTEIIQLTLYVQVLHIFVIVDNNEKMHSTYLVKSSVYSGDQKVIATSANSDVKASPVVKFLLGGSVAWGYEFALGQ